MGNQHIKPIIPSSSQYIPKTPIQIQMLQKLTDDSHYLNPLTEDEKNKIKIKCDYLLKSNTSTQYVYGVHKLKQLQQSHKSANSGQDNFLGEIYYLLDFSDLIQKDLYKQIDGQLIFKGKIVKGKRQGYGIQYNNQDEIFYQGEFKNNQYDGWGVMKNYQGEWKAGKRSGYGKMINQNSKVIYEGKWKQDKFHGMGTFNVQLSKLSDFMQNNYNDKSGDYQRIGEWNQGEAIGWGKSHFQKENQTNSYISKEIYVGEFLNNVPHGQGRLVYDREIIEGTFENGICKVRKQKV